MSNVINGYVSLTDFKAHLTPPRQTLAIDTVDDLVIEDLITVASRRVDDLIKRKFYPRIETRYYDVPEDNDLWLDDDLLAVITLTNGDDTAIASTDYVLKPNNSYPKYCLKLRDTTSVTWEYNSSSSGQQVIDLAGWWGYHEDYVTRAWKQVGTLGAAWESTSTLTATLTAGYTLDTHGGEIIKIDSEILQTDHISSTTLTVQARGDNGSTAATHLISAPIYVWCTMTDIKQLTLEIAKIMYRSRYGETETDATYTQSGIIVTPRSLPAWAREIIAKYQVIV